MPLDIESNDNTASVRVLFSKTVELVCALSNLASQKSSGFTDKEASALYSTLSNRSRDTIALVSQMRLTGLELQEFVLREKVFDDVDLLIRRIRGYDRPNFIYTFLGEELSFEKIQMSCEDPEAADILIKGEKDNKSNSAEVLELLFHKTEEFKETLLGLMQELNSRSFENIVKSQSIYYNKLTEDVKGKLAGKNIMDFSQDFFGKKFIRIYDFRDYLFIPSYFLKPSKMRFFNFNTQIIIFGMDYDSLNKLEAGDRISNVLKVVSDRTRLEILRELSSGTGYGKTLAEKLGLTTSTISHHMELLKDLGLVSEERIKNIKYFNINMQEFEKVLKEMSEYVSGK